VIQHLPAVVKFGSAPAYPFDMIRFPRFGFDKRAS
jgi:hypothetical protein